jgi:hypothetical protein
VFLSEARVDVNPAADLGDNADKKTKVKEDNIKWSQNQVLDELG